MDPRVTLLNDRLDAIPHIARWHWDAWGTSGSLTSVADRQRRLLEWANRDRIPLTLLAVVEGQPAGSASIVDHDMENPSPAYAGMRPWLSGVYVAQAHRNAGLGTVLVRGCEEIARGLGHDAAFLYTAPQTAAGFYEPMGWSECGRPQYEGEEVVVMSRVL